MTDAIDTITESIPCNIIYGRRQAAEGIARAISAAGFTIMSKADVEAVEIQPQEPNEKLKAMWADYEAVNQQKRPPESRLREALEAMLIPFEDSNCRHDHHGYCQEHFLEEDCCVAKARAALAQEDGR